MEAMTGSMTQYELSPGMRHRYSNNSNNETNTKSNTLSYQYKNLSQNDNSVNNESNLSPLAIATMSKEAMAELMTQIQVPSLSVDNPALNHHKGHHHHNCKTSNNLRKVKYAGSETDLLPLSGYSSPSSSSSDSSVNDDEDGDDDCPDTDQNIISSNKNHNNSTENTDNNTVQIKHLRVLGLDITHFSRKTQFILCACGVFGFSLLYGYLQELISVTICCRQLGIFLAMYQFIIYTSLSFVFHKSTQRKNLKTQSYNTTTKTVPHSIYIVLSILRAIDISMTNMAMQYLNYPAKTLMKSSRVVFTMLAGRLISKKVYKPIDYIIVFLMVSGLAIFMHADMQSSAVFQPLGILMLTTSLLCDGAISNMSERIMTQYGIGQDEFIFRLYSMALVGIVCAAFYGGDFVKGLKFISTPGSWDEVMQLSSSSAASVADTTTTSWSIPAKLFILVIFSTAGFLSSSCATAIVKEFGALAMSITSTARKATTLFLSFALFNNVCTLEHVFGIVLFIVALVTKSLRASAKVYHHQHHSHNEKKMKKKKVDDEDEGSWRKRFSTGTKRQNKRKEKSNVGLPIDLKNDSNMRRRERRERREIEMLNIV